MRRALGQFAGWGVAAVLTAALTTPAHAAPIPLKLTPTLPTIGASQVALSYDAATGLFSATSNEPLTFYNPAPISVANSSYAITATIGASGDLLSPGTLLLKGFGGFITLAGGVTGFGYDPTGPAILEFTGTITAQTGANAFPPGTPFGVIIRTQIQNVSFGSSFTVPGTAGGVTSENFATPAAVPEPGTMSLLALGALGLRAARRRR